MATKSWLRKRGYEFTEYNISENQEYADELLKKGFRVTPVVMIGDTPIVGYSPTMLEKALA